MDHNHPDNSGISRVQEVSSHEKQSPDIVQSLDEIYRLSECAAFQKSFSELSTTSERIKFVLSHESVSPVLSKLIAPCDTSESKEIQKNVGVATKFGQDGVDAFQGRRYEVALVYYSIAVRFAPQDRGLLPIALGNRSGAFFQLKQYESALKDIEAAQSHPQYKPYFMLTIRQCQCLLRLGRVAEAKDISDGIKPDDLNQRDANLLTKFYKREEENLKNVKEKEENAEKSNKKDFEPEVLQNLSSVIKILSEKGRFEPRSNISSLSSKVEIRHDEKNGRHLVTTQDIRFGDILGVTKPYATVLTEQQELFFCHHCLTSLKFTRNTFPYNVPCTECVRVLYCSEHCRAESWQSYHRFECQLFTESFKQVLTDNKSSLYLALRTWFVAGGLESIRAVIDKFPPDSDPTENADFTDDSMDYYENVYRMVISDDDSIEERIKAIIIVAVLFKWSKLDEAYDPDLKIEDSDKKIFAISTLLRHYLQIQSNETLFMRGDQSSLGDPTASLEYISTLDPQIRLLKNSCDPNTSIIVVDCAKSVHASNVCVFFALKPIAAGTVLSAVGPTYGDSIKYRIYLRDFLQMRQLLWHDSVPRHVCPCEHCQVKRRASALGSSSLSDRDGHELVCCGGNCGGIIRPTDDGGVNCFTCKREILPGELIELKCISRNICRWYSQTLVLIINMKKLIKVHDKKANVPKQFRTLLTELEPLITDRIAPLALKHSRVMLIDLYKNLNAFYRYCYTKEPNKKFDHLKKAWKYADASHLTLDGHFGGDSLDLLVLFQENVLLFKKAIDEIRLGQLNPIEPVAGGSKKNSRLNFSTQDDETRNMRVWLVGSFENVKNRLRIMHERYDMI